MTALVDTNILVYQYDSRFPQKQRKAIDCLEDGLTNDQLVVPHQAIVEFVAATTRKIRSHQILDVSVATIEAEELLRIYPIVYPNEIVLRTAIRGLATYRLSWFDAHLWAYAEVHGCDELWSEEFEHGRYYGSVKIVNPFLLVGDIKVRGSGRL